MRQSQRLLIIASLWAVLSVSGQESVDSGAESDLYFRALVAATEKKTEAYGQDDPTKNNVDVYVGDRLTGVENIFDTGRFPRQSGRFEFHYLEPDEIFRRFQKNKDDKFRINVVGAMRNQGTSLVVYVNDYWVSLSKRKLLQYELEGGARVVFEYDSKLSQFVIKDVILWGV